MSPSLCVLDIMEECTFEENIMFVPLYVEYIEVLSKKLCTKNLRISKKSSNFALEIKKMVSGAFLMLNFSIVI